MSHIHAIIYDLDGVLVDACDWHYHSLNRALQKVCGGVWIDRDEHEKDFNGLPTNAKLEILESRGVIRKEDFEKIWALKQDITTEIIEETAVFDDEKFILHNEIYDTFGIKSACVTNSIRKTAELMLKKTGQFDFMDFIITNEDVSSPKPSPEGYNLAVKKLGLSPNNILIVEDSEKGYKAACSSGCNVFRVKNSKEVNFQSIKKIILGFNK